MILGGPEGPPERWQYIIYAGPSDVRRAAAADLQRTPASDEHGQRRWDLPGGFQGYRTDEGYYLLTRDEMGWYVVAEAQHIVGRAPYHVLNELRRGAVWARRQGMG